MDEDDESFPRVTRYMLQQVCEAKAGEYETEYTAVITVIGDAPLKAFERALKSLNYKETSYQTLPAPSSGTWLKRSRKRLPSCGAGLIAFSEQSNLGLYLLIEEVRRYQEVGIRPLLVQARTQRFTNAAREILARYELHCPIVQLDGRTSANIAKVSDSFVDTLMTAVEAVLLPGVYPGLMGIDPADIACVYAMADLRIFTLNANLFEELVPMIDSAGTATHSDVLAALYGPYNLKLREIHLVAESVRCWLHEDAAFLQSAIADEARSSYTLYLVTSIRSSIDARQKSAAAASPRRSIAPPIQDDP